MRNLLIPVVAVALMGTAGSAAAGAETSSSIFVAESQPMLLAQANAVDDYAHYLHEMMMKDKKMIPMLDGNNDGEVSDKEFRNAYERVFQKFDKNNDGMIDKNELSTSNSAGA